MTKEIDSGTLQWADEESIYRVANLEGKRHQSRAGYWFDERDSVWQLDKDTTVYLERLRTALSEGSVEGCISTLANYAKTTSASHTRNIADRCSAMLNATGANSIGNPPENPKC